MSHFDELSILTPDLKERRILDVGAGKGSFVIDCVKRGAKVEGLEYNPAYIAEAEERARQANVVISLKQGVAEHLPYGDGSFDFLNFSEVIEHVEDPEQALREAYRVLAPGGRAYISVPNRFGLRDQHYHLYFVNWLPRAWSEGFIKIFGREKQDDGHAGHQKLTEMHYYTYGGIKALCRRKSFTIRDIRKEKLKRKFEAGYPVVLPIYMLARVIYFDSFHLFLSKDEK